ncbi:zona pellucida sperm-binding protein 3 [Anoplopoma fimbria]|uniref:zona pellucida sperm-binding protein 3 n=1 Tax=Anoplopoma fimbria TaxID=229290 RepID=UPI0023EC0419|nr:zona pellucida sperm-binding protein 3 [Anoplopoma fimbria]
MVQMHAGIVLLLFCSAHSFQFRGPAKYGPFVQDPEREWDRLATMIDEEMTEDLAPETKLLKSATAAGSPAIVPLNVNAYLVVSSSEDHKALFKPELGARPLPSPVKELLEKTASTTPSTGPTPKALIEILCHVDRIYVRIRREVFKTTAAYKYLKLGACVVNQGTAGHYYLLYLLETDCGFKKEYGADNRRISNTLLYNPTGPVLREMPFAIPLVCNYPRFFHSYKVGFYPTLQQGTVYKALQPKSSFTLTPQDASGNVITGTRTYTLGEPMYFEVKNPDSSTTSAAKRVYINYCFMTASSNPNSTPKYTIIQNQGCMVEGKVNKDSKFLPCTSMMVQKFSVGAFIFKEKVSTYSSSQQLYLHCEVSLGPLTPSQTSKACNYDYSSSKWKALFGDDSLCTCCDSTCLTATNKASRSRISSHSWKVDMRNQDRSDKVEPQRKFLDADSFSLEDPDMVEHQDSLMYWKHDD